MTKRCYDQLQEAPSTDGKVTSEHAPDLPSVLLLGKPGLKVASEAEGPLPVLTHWVPLARSFRVPP